MPVYLPEVTWTDVETTDADAAVLPVGSTEQHGPHAPLGLDTLSAEAVAGAGAARYESTSGRPVLVAPSVPVGVAEEHRAFAGTLWVSEDAFRQYVREVIENLADAVDRVIVVNGHGGNVPALREICARLTRDDVCYAVPFTWFDAVDVESVVPDLPLGHGGPVETSLIRHVAPELIHEERFEEAAAGAGERFGEWAGGTNLAYDFDRFADSGNVGDPSAASADAGELLLEAAAERLTEVLVAVEGDAGDDANAEG
jgi:creatinine amidohydrolase